jgi:hypothetical protein
MIRAAVENGLIRPLDPMPAGWVEGHRVVVEDCDSTPDDDVDAWYRTLQEMGPAQYELGEWDFVQSVMAEADQQAKDLVRRAMGLD